MTIIYMEKIAKLINCDLGECLVPNHDGEIMPLIDQASIACGGHAGNNASMDSTVQLAKRHNVRIGVHPSYPDKAHFGRVSLAMSQKALFDSILMQVSALEQISRRHQIRIDYIKPHGALYHDMMNSEHIIELLCDVAKTMTPPLKLIVQAGIKTSEIKAIAKQKGVELQFEAFADRAYQGAHLKPRSEEGALLATPTQIQRQYLQLIESGLSQVDTICFHSDHPPSLIALKNIATSVSC